MPTQTRAQVLDGELAKPSRGVPAGPLYRLARAWHRRTPGPNRGNPELRTMLGNLRNIIRQFDYSGNSKSRERNTLAPVRLLFTTLTLRPNGGTPLRPPLEHIAIPLAWMRRDFDSLDRRAR